MVDFLVEFHKKPEHVTGHANVAKNLLDYCVRRAIEGLGDVDENYPELDSAAIGSLLQMVRAVMSCAADINRRNPCWDFRSHTSKSGSIRLRSTLQSTFPTTSRRNILRKFSGFDKSLLSFSR